MISISHLSVGYGHSLLLRDASAAFPSASLTALIGRNGSGKSTLLRTLASLASPLSGSIAIDGTPLSAMSHSERAKAIAFVTTERIRVPNLRCRDVVALGRTPYTNWFGRMQPSDVDIVEAALRQVGMTDYADRTLDRMSDGECQRIMIARALAQQTPVILLDEPTSFLDLPNRHILCSLLADIAHSQGKTIIFSTHELDIARSLADYIALIDSPSLILAPPDDPEIDDAVERLFAICK